MDYLVIDGPHYHAIATLLDVGAGRCNLGIMNFDTLCTRSACQLRILLVDEHNGDTIIIGPPPPLRR